MILVFPIDSRINSGEPLLVVGETKDNTYRYLCVREDGKRFHSCDGREFRPSWMHDGLQMLESTDLLFDRHYRYLATWEIGCLVDVETPEELKAYIEAAERDLTNLSDIRNEMLRM